MSKSEIDSKINELLKLEIQRKRAGDFVGAELAEQERRDLWFARKDAA